VYEYCCELVLSPESGFVAGIWVCRRSLSLFVYNEEKKWAQKMFVVMVVFTYCLIV
jgi:hypothetical protein